MSLNVLTSVSFRLFLRRKRGLVTTSGVRLVASTMKPTTRTAQGKETWYLDELAEDEGVDDGA